MLSTLIPRGWLGAIVRRYNHRMTSSSSRSADADIIQKETPGGKDRLIIVDTTLRDGEQAPGIALKEAEKLQIARQLSMLGVDVCEAGFPITSNSEFETVKTIASEVGPLETGRAFGLMTIMGLCRADNNDIQRCYDAVKYAPRHRIHVFLATSDIHLKHKLHISREQCIAKAVEAVRFAASLCSDVQFGCEDATRSDRDFVVQVVDEVIKAGAKTICIADTVGYSIPEEFGSLTRYVKENMNSTQDVVLSAHCHNDLGLATANTLKGVQNGARQVDVTINGIGERAGNTSLEEVVMAVRTRPKFFPVFTSVNTWQITKTSEMVEAFTGVSVQPNKAIVGANAFAHEAGIHQDGVMKHPQTYEIMTPESVGLASNCIVLGKHSGRHAYKKRLEKIGHKDISPKRLDLLVQKFKAMADDTKVITDADMQSIIANEF